MKKICFLIIVGIICLSLSSMAEKHTDSIISPYYNALRLSVLIKFNGPTKMIINEHTNPDTLRLLGNLLKPYLTDSSLKKNPSVTSIIILLTDKNSHECNPFISKYFTVTSASDKGEPLIVPGNGNILPNAVGGLDVTNISKGLALFMIERAKQELNIAFFDQFKNFVEKNPEIQIMFPKTSEALANLLSYTYPTMIPTLRGKFEEDLAALPVHFEKIFDLPRYQKLSEQYPAIKVVFKSIPLLFQLGNKSYAPIDIIRDFAAFPEWKEAPKDSDFQNTGNAIKLAGILSESLRINIGKDSSGWVTPKKLYDDIIKDPITKNLYIGLVFGMIRKEEIVFYTKSGKIKLADTLIKRSTFITLYQDQLLQLTETISSEIKEIKKTLSKGEQPTVENYNRYLSSCIDAVELGFDIAKYFNVSINNYPDYIIIFRNVNDLYKNIYNRQYTPAIINSITIIDKTITLIGNNVQQGKGKAKNDNLAKITKFQNRLTDLSRYGIFMSNMTQAQSPEEVQNAIEAAALPVGSSVIKKYSDFNISIQSYVGAYCLFNKSTSSTVNTWNNSFGITAPIGVSFSTGLRNAGSISLFGSLIDLGAIVDYDLKTTTDTAHKTTTTTKDFKIELGQIFSPGVYLVYGAGAKIPLSLGIGAQYGPGLGKVNNGQTIVNNPSWRYSVFLCVDIPMFNLFNKTGVPWKHCVGKGK